MCGAQPVQMARQSLARFSRADEGQDLLEYGFLVALISIVAITVARSSGLVGQQIDQVFWQTIAASLARF